MSRSCRGAQGYHRGSVRGLKDLDGSVRADLPAADSDAAWLDRIRHPHLRVSPCSRDERAAQINGRCGVIIGVEHDFTRGGGKSLVKAQDDTAGGVVVDVNPIIIP